MQSRSSSDTATGDHTEVGPATNEKNEATNKIQQQLTPSSDKDEPSKISRTPTPPTTINPPDPTRSQQQHPPTPHHTESERKILNYDPFVVDQPYIQRPSPNLQNNHRSKSGDSENSNTGLGILKIDKEDWKAALNHGKEKEWLPEEKMEAPWISLFYDLVVVAVLSVFSTRTELTTGSNIISFFGFFTILWWTWFSQVSYDVRFQAKDNYHKLMKLVQVVLFVFLGAVSAGFNPGKIMLAENPFQAGATTRSMANQAFFAVALIYTISRAILAGQYLVVCYLARQANRAWLPLLCTASYTFLSCIFGIIATCLHSNTNSLVVGRIFCLYFAVLVEVLGEVVSTFFKSHIKRQTERFSERLGGLSLIILGEGFISLTRSVNAALAGFSQSNNSTYIDAFCAIAAIYILFNLFFIRFEVKQWMGKKRTIIWALLLFPMHFVLLLLLSSCNNIVLHSAFGSGVSWTQYTIIYPSETLNVPNSNFSSLYEDKNLALQLGKLPLIPTWKEELDYVTGIYNETYITNTSVVEPPIYLQREILKYVAQVFIQGASSYGVEIAEETFEAYAELSKINVTHVDDEVLSEERLNELTTLYSQIILNFERESLNSVLWTFPSAGGTLLLITTTHIVRYGSRGRKLWLLESIQVVFGVGLCLLGLLDLGNKDLMVDLSGGEVVFVGEGHARIYDIWMKDWILPAITICFAALYSWQKHAITIIKRRDRKIKEEEEAKKNTPEV